MQQTLKSFIAAIAAIIAALFRIPLAVASAFRQPPLSDANAGLRRAVENRIAEVRSPRPPRPVAWSAAYQQARHVAGHGVPAPDTRGLPVPIRAWIAALDQRDAAIIISAGGEKMQSWLSGRSRRPEGLRPLPSESEMQEFREGYRQATGRELEPEAALAF